MHRLFQILVQAVEGMPLVAAIAAVMWGGLSILLSPCHLASIPLIVGFIDLQGKIPARRAFLISLLFSLGILMTISVIGVITAAAGRMMGDVGRWGNYGVASIFFAVGLYLLEVITLPLPSAVQPGIQRKGLVAALILGLVFGVAMGPCSFAYMAPMLAVTFRLAAANLSYGIMLLMFYGVGHCAVIVLAGTFAGMVQHYLNWNERSRGAIILKKTCGLLVIIAGLWLLYAAR
ncbi:MAG: cytochrome c biogenesis protein CcdA [Anaerolineales bacterium]|nr:cytochrome c biogenesis protein CcdA [Anaerolineales bacterium]